MTLEEKEVYKKILDQCLDEHSMDGIDLKRFFKLTMQFAESRILSKVNECKWCYHKKHKKPLDMCVICNGDCWKYNGGEHA